MTSTLTDHNHSLICDLPINYASQVLQLFRQAWWSKDRSIEDTIAVMHGSTACFGVLDKEGKLIVFARVLSDLVEKAMIFDVIVDESYKKQGLGTTMLTEVLKSKYCRNTRHIELYCKEEMIPFYNKLGFENITPTVKLLRKKIEK